MQDASTISAADPLTVQSENLTLRRENAHLHCLNAELLDTINKQKSRIEQLEARLDWLIRQHFGQRSERVNPGQGSLFAEPEGESEPPPPSPPDEEVVVKRKKKGHGRQKAAKELARETHVIDVPESEKRCPCCGGEKICIGQDKTERHDYQPPKIFIRETVRPTYMCRECEQQGRPIQASQAPLPPEPIPRSIAAPGLLAHLIVSKYWDHLPLYRQGNMLERLGWHVARSTLCDLVMASADALTPLYELMCDQVRLSEALHADDSQVTLLDPLRKAYAWVYVGDKAHPFTVFDMSVGRVQEHPRKFLNGYRGFIHADGYTGYNPLYQAGATHVGCWMHARRYFFEAKENDPARAHEALARIRELYVIEAEIKEQNLTGGELVECRRQRAGPILDDFAAWLTAETPKTLPKSKIGEAFIYASNQWPTLIRYIHDARLHIDNHPAEQAIRAVALGRKNWLHIGGDGGLPRAAVLTLSSSAKNLAEGIAKLRASHVGLVVLVNRYDGIDLPHAACRVLIVDGLPDVRRKIECIDQSLLDGSEQLKSQSIQRIEQGMGRGIRSSEDYCVVILMGRSLISMLYADNSLSLFTPATRAQLELSQKLADQLRGKPVAELEGVMNSCLTRDRKWVAASKGVLVKLRPTAEGSVRPLAEKMRKAFDAVDIRDYPQAERLIQEAINAATDKREKGWLKQLLAEYTNYTNTVEAQKLVKSALGENRALLKPIDGIAYTRLMTPDANQAKQCSEYLVENYGDGNKIVIAMNGILEELDFITDNSSRFEEALKNLGFFIGFRGQRPESEVGKGPDNVWEVGSLKYFVIEAKNGATTDTITKDYCNQLGGSMNWFAGQYDSTCSATPIMIHPSHVFEHASSPHAKTRIIDAETLQLLRDACRKFAQSVANKDAYRMPATVAELLKAHGLTADLILARFTVKFRVK